MQHGTAVDEWESKDGVWARAVEIVDTSMTGGVEGVKGTRASSDGRRKRGATQEAGDARG